MAHTAHCCCCVGLCAGVVPGSSVKHPSVYTPHLAETADNLMAINSLSHTDTDMGVHSNTHAHIHTHTHSHWSEDYCSIPIVKRQTQTDTLNTHAMQKWNPLPRAPSFPRGGKTNPLIFPWASQPHTNTTNHVTKHRRVWSALWRRPLNTLCTFQTRFPLFSFSGNMSTWWAQIFFCLFLNLFPGYSIGQILPSDSSPQAKPEKPGGGCQ